MRGAGGSPYTPGVSKHLAPLTCPGWDGGMGDEWDGGMGTELHLQRWHLPAPGGGSVSRSSPEGHSEPGARHETLLWYSHFLVHSFPKHCSAEGKMPLLLLRHPSGSCASSAMALGDFTALVSGRGA